MSIFDEFNEEGIEALRPTNRTFLSLPDTSGNALDAIAFSGSESRLEFIPSIFADSPFGDTSVERFIVNFEEEDLESRVDNQPQTKFRARFVPDKSFFESGTRPPEMYGIRLYAKLRDPIREKIRNKEIRVTKIISLFSDSGLSYSNIEHVFGVTLGKDIVDYIERGDSAASDLAIQLAKWMGLNLQSNEGYNFVATIAASIRDFASRFPNTRDVNPLEEAFSFFALLIELSVLDLINTAEFIASEILKPLANEIRSWKLKEERWNAKLGDTYDPFIKSPSQIRKDLVQFFNGVDANTNTQVDTKINRGTGFVAIPNYSIQEQKESTKSSITIWIEVIGDMMKGYFSNLEGFIDAVAEDPEASIELVNAFVVGVINGVLDLLARLVEDVANLLELIHPEKLRAFIQGIEEFITKASFKKLEALLVKELRQLFSFLDGDDIYTNVYQMGVSMAKFAEIIINVYFGSKGVLRFGAAVIEVGKEIPDALKAFGNLVDDLFDRIHFKSLTAEDIRKLKELGIRLDISSSKGAFIGVPIKKSDGNFYTVSYRDIVLERTTDKKKMEAFFNKLLDNHPNDLRNAYRKEKTSLLKKSQNFKSYVKKWEDGIKRYEKSSNLLDTDRVLLDWFSNKKIQKKPLSKSRATVFNEEYRKRYEGLEFANIATGKIRLLDKKGKVIFERNDYISHSGSGDKIPPTEEFPFGSIERANLRFEGEKKKFVDPIENKGRHSDSENPMLRDMEEDVILAADRAGLDINELRVEMIIETTYEPCIICKREIMLRQQLFGNSTTIEVEYPILSNGKGVVGHPQLEIFLKK